jgi:aminoglycoside/choline kinase family phosphotransferase
VEYPTSIRGHFARDLEVLEWCRGLGIRVPAVLAADPDGGRALLEDVGSEDLESALRSAHLAAQRRRLLRLALTPLEILAEVPPAALPRWNPALGRSRMRWELAGFELWYVRHLRRRRPTDELSSWLDELVEEIDRHPLRVCHRDYHFNNLLVSGSDLVVIDVQDILVGPDTYDLVSLVFERSATRLLEDEDVDWVIEEWARQTAATSGWRQRAARVRVQRGLKVLGTFARLVLTGRSRYEPWLHELQRDLVRRLPEAGAPPVATAFLLD